MTHGDIGIFTADASLVVQTWDPWMEAATAIASGTAQGQPLAQLIPDLESRGVLPRFDETLRSGTVQVFTPAFHRYVIPCPPRHPSRHFDYMQQRVTVAPLMDGGVIIGIVVTVQDVTRQLESEQDLDGFAPALRDEDWRVRRAAVQSLASRADAELLDAVLATLRREHRNFSTLSSALRLLAVTDVDITKPLAGLLGDDDVDLRIQAALALGDQHDATAVDALIGALQDPDTNVRFHAIESLGRLRADAAVEPLVEIIERRDFFLAFAALDAVALINDSRIAPRLVPLLEDEGLRPAVANALRSLADDRVVDALVDVLNRTAAAALPVVAALVAISERCEKQSRSAAHVPAAVSARIIESGRAHALAAISEADSESLPSATRFLGWLPGDADAIARLVSLVANAGVRSAAVDALVLHGDSAVDALLELLAAHDREVRDAAVTALARLGTRRATPALLELLPDPAHAITVAGALAKIGDPAAFEPLLAMVGHTQSAIRLAAIGALNSIGHPSMPARVLALLQSPDPVIRESAVRIAGYFGYRDAASAVVAAASDSAESVRTAALEHLPYLDDSRVLAILQHAIEAETAKARAAAARALARVEDDGAGRALLTATSDTDHWVRYFATRSLGERRYAPAFPRLASLAESDPMPHVRAAALNSLAAAYPELEVGLLNKGAGDPERDVAAAAIAAMGAVVDADALVAIAPAARAPEAWKRQAAVRALALHGSPAAVTELEWLAGGDADAAVAEAAIGALAKIAVDGRSGMTAAVESLVSLCGDPARRDLASAAIVGLTPALMPLVARGLVHPQPAVRRRIVDALGRVLHPEATAFVVQAFADEDPIVREMAALAIARLGNRSADDALRRLAEADPSKSVRGAAAAALASVRKAG